MIKPEAMPYRAEITAKIRQNLDITEQKELILADWAISEIYDDLSEGLWLATRFALSRTVELGLVQGDNAIAKMYGIAGTRTAPKECENDSLRFLYGIAEPIFVGGVKYYKNAIHRPRNSKEAIKDIGIFRRL